MCRMASARRTRRLGWPSWRRLRLRIHPTAHACASPAGKPRQPLQTPAVMMHASPFLPGRIRFSTTGGLGLRPAGCAEARVLVSVAIAEAWLAEPAVVVRRHPTGGWSHAVKQASPGVRIYRGWWACRHDAASALPAQVALVSGGESAAA